MLALLDCHAARAARNDERVRARGCWYEHVNSYVEKLAAETAARQVEGVRAVAKKIEVRLLFDAK